MNVSIIIPACNEEKYIEETLVNIPSKFETIVVCNGCTDRTEDIVKKYSVKLISTKKRGTSMAKNLGAKNATNPRLIFLDADIIINERVINAISNSEANLGAIKLKPNPSNYKSKISMAIKNFGARFISGGGVVFCDSDLFEKVGGFDENLVYGEDNNFFRKAKKLGKYGFVNETGIVSMRRQEIFGYLRNQLYHIKLRLRKKTPYPLIR